jgi:hypothetical protein
MANYLDKCTETSSYYIRSKKLPCNDKKDASKYKSFFILFISNIHNI